MKPTFPLSLDVRFADCSKCFVFLLVYLTRWLDPHLSTWFCTVTWTPRSHPFVHQYFFVVGIVVVMKMSSKQYQLSQSQKQNRSIKLWWHNVCNFILLSKNIRAVQTQSQFRKLHCALYTLRYPLAFISGHWHFIHSEYRLPRHICVWNVAL